jgi:hypothetical protein
MFLLFVDNGGCHRRRGKEEGKKSIQTPLLLGFSCGGAWRRRAATVPVHCSCIFQKPLDVLGAVL